MTRRNPLRPLLFDSEIESTACKNRREIRRSLQYIEEGQEDDIYTTTEEMADNQNNPLRPAIATNPAEQNPVPHTMYDYAKPTLTGTESSIVRPAVFANNFELKPNTIQMIQQFVQFDGLQDEDPNTHLAIFLEFCDTFKINSVSDDVFAFGRTLNNKTPEEAYEFIEEMPLNNYQWQVMRTKPTKAAGVFNLDAVTILSNQVELLNKKIDSLYGSTQVHLVMRCESNGGGVHNTDYPSFNSDIEEEQRNHPNFSWGGHGNQRPQHPPGFQQSPYQQEKKLNLEEMLTKFISMSETHFQNTEIALKNQQASIQGLETQIGQLAKLIYERPQGGLPSNTETNPREQLHAITVHNDEGLVEAE
ncbi:hypothetical protein CXB51_016295 [Gossypium anomalum]|uniref:Retrotransposon gag domain-containing protein n=1 Tax=Gossypium anomalum TaxID=47600 RepID=A0A8J5YR64_9ROSI|nr:hypothetical protein CXB51_016295 [Gossypium anomalum]